MNETKKIEYWDTYCYAEDPNDLGEEFNEIRVRGMDTLDIDSFIYGNRHYVGFEMMSQMDIDSWMNELSEYYESEEIKNHTINPSGSSDLKYVRIFKLKRTNLI